MWLMWTFTGNGGPPRQTESIKTMLLMIRHPRPKHERLLVVKISVRKSSLCVLQEFPSDNETTTLTPKTHVDDVRNAGSLQKKTA